MEIAPAQVYHSGTFGNLIGSLHSYFPDVEEKSAQLDWVRNPFLLSEANRRKLPVSHQEQLLDVSSDCGLQINIDSHTVVGVCEERAP